MVSVLTSCNKQGGGAQTASLLVPHVSLTGAACNFKRARYSHILSLNVHSVAKHCFVGVDTRLVHLEKGVAPHFI